MTEVWSDTLFGELRSLLRIYQEDWVSLEARGFNGTAEAAVVLGAQVLSGGHPSGALEARVMHAAQVYARGEAELVIPTGGVGRHRPSEAAVSARMLVEAGVPERAILVEGKARNTWESARLVAAMAQKRGIGSLLIVTDPLHCVRAVGVFRAEGGLPARASPVYGSPMWRRRGLRRRQLLREMAALCWYRAKRRAG